MKRALPSQGTITGEEIKKRHKKADGFEIDLSDVPPQQPVPKIKGRIKEGASKYTGVCFKKARNKWTSTIVIDGKKRHIGLYENEEEAAIDYARAVFKYNGQGALDKAMKMSSPAVDLSDIPAQSPILKSGGRVKKSSSRYAGVSFNTKRNKWHAQIVIDGKDRHIGSYMNEEEAAIDYARAKFKYRRSGKEFTKCEKKDDGFVIDLTDIPSQQPIPNEVSSKYTGVSFNKRANKWDAKIRIEGKLHHIGYYVNEEEAAITYARALFKYKGQDALDKAREQALSGSETAIHSSNVTQQQPQPIPKSEGRIIEGGLKYYEGATFDERANKWVVQPLIDGNQRLLGYYDYVNEGAVADDHTRAASNYRS